MKKLSKKSAVLLSMIIALLFIAGYLTFNYFTNTYYVNIVKNNKNKVYNQVFYKDLLKYNTAKVNWKTYKLDDGSHVVEFDSIYKADEGELPLVIKFKIPSNAKNTTVTYYSIKGLSFTGTDAGDTFVSLCKRYYNDHNMALPPTATKD